MKFLEQNKNKQNTPNPAKSHVFVTATQHHFMNTFGVFFFVPEESWSKKLGGSHLPFWTGPVDVGVHPPQFAVSRRILRPLLVIQSRSKQKKVDPSEALLRRTDFEFFYKGFLVDSLFGEAFLLKIPWMKLRSILLKLRFSL